jgi:hypothetical protein
LTIHSLCGFSQVGIRGHERRDRTANRQSAFRIRVVARGAVRPRAAGVRVGGNRPCRPSPRREGVRVSCPLAPADDYGFFHHRWIAACTIRVIRAVADHGSRGRKSPRGIAANTFRISASATVPKAATDGPPDAHSGVRPVSGADDLKARAVSIAGTAGRRFFPRRSPTL